MRLCSIWDPARRASVLCALGAEGDLRPVGGAGGSPGDIAEMLAYLPATDSLEDAVASLGVTEPFALWDEVATGGVEPTGAHLMAPVRPPEV